VFLIFHFHLHDSNHWHEYSVFGNQRRRCTLDYHFYNNDDYYQESDYDATQNYEYEYEYFTPESFTNHLTDSAKACTMAIAVWFKALCVDWTDQKGLQFTFDAKQDGDDNHAVSSACQAASNRFNALDKTLSFNDDLVQNMLHNLIDYDQVYGGPMNTYHQYGKCYFVHFSSNSQRNVIFEFFKI